VRGSGGRRGRRAAEGRWGREVHNTSFKDSILSLAIVSNGLLSRPKKRGCRSTGRQGQGEHADRRRGHL
jgi:hypothetical protein